MGFYSNLAIDYADFRDNSYPTPDRQLIGRLEELYSHLELLEEVGEAPEDKDDGLRLSEDELRYATPQHLGRIIDVVRAIEIAINDLQSDYGIDVTEQPACEECFDDVPAVGQMNFDELEIFKPYNQMQKVA